MKPTKPKAKKVAKAKPRATTPRSRRADAATRATKPSTAERSAALNVVGSGSKSEGVAEGRVCVTCAEWKPWSEFFKKRSGPNGHHTCCKPCHGLWAAKNRDKVNASNAAWRRRQGPQYGMESSRKWRAANAERAKAVRHARWLRTRPHEPAPPKDRKASMKAYYERNKWKWTVFTRERQAATLRATPVWYDRDLVGEVYRLAECRTKLTGIRWEVDHIVPLRGETVCGLHTLDNLRVIPAAVNRAKSNTWTGEVAPW